MRGPGWLWFWPWEYWDSHRIVAETNYDLTQFFGIDSKSLLGSVIGGFNNNHIFFRWGDCAICNHEDEK